MWLWLSLGSAVLLGLYDVAKKHALKRNSVLWILFCSTALTALFLCPFLSIGPAKAHLQLAVKSILVSASWVSGLVAMRLLPLTTVSTFKASRPMFVVLFSIVLFGERLSLLQWLGVILIMLAVILIGRTSARQQDTGSGSGIGLIWIAISVLSGAASALYDKHILKSLEPLFVQSWTNVYVTVIIGILLLIKALRKSSSTRSALRWDYRLVLIAVLITVADALYFYALSDSQAMLSIVSMLRRCSVIVTFLFGALFFKESNIRSKAVYLIIMFVGLLLLLY